MVCARVCTCVCVCVSSACCAGPGTWARGGAPVCVPVSECMGTWPSRSVSVCWCLCLCVSVSVSSLCVWVALLLQPGLQHHSQAALGMALLGRVRVLLGVFWPRLPTPVPLRQPEPQLTAYFHSRHCGTSPLPAHSPSPATLCTTPKLEPRVAPNRPAPALTKSPLPASGTSWDRPAPSSRGCPGLGLLLLQGS